MLAQKDHLPAKILTSEEAARIAPDFHAEDTTSKALFFPSDGTAEPVRIVDYYKTEAKARGVLMLDTISPQLWDPSAPKLWFLLPEFGPLDSSKILTLISPLYQSFTHMPTAQTDLSEISSSRSFAGQRNTYMQEITATMTALGATHMYPSLVPLARVHWRMRRLMGMLSNSSI
jgi:hypothetical protein